MANQRRTWLLAASLIASVIVSTVVVRSYWRPVTLAAAPADLFGVRFVDGQVQLLHGTFYDINRDGLGDPATRPLTIRRPWNAAPAGSQITLNRPDVRQVHLTMRNWPPLAEEASLLVGGFASRATSRPASRPTSLEFRLGYEIRARAMSSWLVVLPLWGASALLLRRWLLARGGPGLCPGCGYDLRATPDRCPECGTISASAKSPGPD